MSASKQELIIALAAKLKPILRKPMWADFVKTGVHKERPPTDSDWWFMRGASLLLKVQKLQPIGVSKLRRHYGGRKNRGVAPEHFFKGSGNILRKLLQQLEQVGLIKQDVRAGHKGRVLTPKAVSLIAKTSREVEKLKPKKKDETPVAVPKPVEHKKAETPDEAKPAVEAKEDPKPEEKAEQKKEKPAKHDAKKEAKKHEPKNEEPKAVEPKKEAQPAAGEQQ
ncbi:40S ribosomal protein S19 [Candidatus Woesearchaeota archaeon]|nr:40S ribosomal protein S19 [Candidatus Woesearchaeota archaeon]